MREPTYTGSHDSDIDSNDKLELVNKPNSTDVNRERKALTTQESNMPTTSRLIATCPDAINPFVNMAQKRNDVTSCIVGVVRTQTWEPAIKC